MSGSGAAALRRSLPLLAALAIVFASLAVQIVHSGSERTLMGDYRAFYCAARVAMHRENPYASAPLHACEAKPVPPPLFQAKRNEVLPAPLPGYAVAAFMPFALLPFAFSAAVWAIVSCAAFGMAIRYLWRLKLGSIPLLLAAFALPLAATSLPVGELPPIALAGIALLAWAMTNGRPAAVVAGLALAMCEPQIGIAAAAATIVLSRRFALVTLLTLGGLALISLLTLGAAENVQYVRAVLPEHVLAELPRASQFSLSWIFDRAGASATVAIGAGRLQYVCGIALAALIARTKAARETPALGIFAAAALAVTGGPFVHLDHIALAMPALLLLALRARAERSLVIAACVALAVPLLFLVSTPATLIVVPFIVAWLVAALSEGRDAALRASAIGTLTIAIVLAVVARYGTGLHASAIHAGAAAASETWGAYIRRSDVMDGWAIWLLKIPTWFALLTAAALSSLNILPKASAASSDLYREAARGLAE
ncbi:MAG: hypothetical protein M3R35_06285 [Candidatus Eremiobacteraeota bacterium]|nr:hypothetical protein [Candidatus Eremiobacteraeota bacterium]